MIDSVRLQGFKCFNDNFFELKPLTILSGRNASGKTSFLHSLALLHQTACECINFEQLVLNGPVVQLGRAEDALNKITSRDSICIEINAGSELWERDYIASDRKNFKLGQKTPKAGQDAQILRLFRNLTYLSADRLGPRETHSLEESVNYADVGARGERTISHLLTNEDYRVPEAICIPDSGPVLLKQVQAHMQRIFPGFHFDIQTVEGTNNATLRFTTNEGIGFVRPQNIGFGLSFTLPIYAACLSARPGDVVLIENPEAHLHPYAQSQIGDFLSLVASAGIQIIIETHSDHVLNGIRKSIKSPDHPIKAENTAVFFFAELNEDSEPNIISPVISDDGSISEWPEDFFNQYEKDLSELVGW
jgi:predicted ATPase